jgi:hypothetical protein
MMLYDYLPGQEEANLDFVREVGMGGYEEVRISFFIFYFIFYFFTFFPLDFVCLCAPEGGLAFDPQKNNVACEKKACKTVRHANKMHAKQ